MSRWSAASCRAPSSTCAASGRAAGGAAQPGPAAGPRDVHHRRGAATPCSPGPAPSCASAATGCAPPTARGAVSAERGYLREVGNLIFHLAVLVVLVGFAIGSLFGYKGGVIMVGGTPFANNPTQYDDFVPGSLFRADRSTLLLHGEEFDVDWLDSGPRAGMARGFQAHMTYADSPGDRSALRPGGQPPAHRRQHRAVPDRTRLRPGDHRPDGKGHVTWTGPTVFLPQSPDFLCFGVVKAPDAKPQIGLRAFSTRRSSWTTATRRT